MNKYLPKTWCDINVYMDYKKGDGKNLNNYRGIALISTIIKIFTR